MSVRGRSIITLSLFLLLSVLLGFALIYYAEELKKLSIWGYPLIFFISFIAGSSLPIPAPYIVVVFAMAPILNPFLVGVVSGLGAGLGGWAVYLLGRCGGFFLPSSSPFISPTSGAVSRWAHRITDWAQNRSSLVVFLMSVLINPAFGPMALTMGALKFPVVRFLLLCLAGNTIKSLAISYAGYLGLTIVLGWLGVSI